jgi:ATP phosphoribosyltransferase regulatory subunit
MNETPVIHPALLPVGLRDVLPPEAELEAKSVETIMECFAAHGYQRVSTPLLEFEESLFAGAGTATIEQTFRLMDPESQRMIGVRADITPQIGRVASTRLAHAPRPLRLAYAGQCLRVRGGDLQNSRQIGQAGIELIGPDAAEADAEIILTAAQAFTALGLAGVSFDLTFPRLVLSLLDNVEAAALPGLTHALDRKDRAAIAGIGGGRAKQLLQLLDACGPAERAIPALLAIDLPDAAKAHAGRMADTVEAVRKNNATLSLTADLVEFRGYKYHTGICVTVFATGQQAELGRGGRYLCGTSEPATGITLYPDTIVRIAPAASLRPRLYLQYGTSPEIAASCRQQNFATVMGLAPVKNPLAEAIRLGCSHYFKNNNIASVAGETE